MGKRVKSYMKIKSTYREKNKNFTMTVIDEKEDYYLVRLDKEWQSQFQAGETITKLPKRLIGSLYEIEKESQMSIFDLI